MNVIDLFCGAGGFSKGFLNQGFDILLGIDNDYKKLNTYYKNIPAKYCLTKDVTTSSPLSSQTIKLIKQKNNIVKLSELSIQETIKNDSIDIIIGSPPCKDFSSANILKSFKSTRASLFKHFIRFVTTLIPTWFVIENVPSFFSFSTINSINSSVQNLGYSTRLLLLNAKNFNIPQDRKRGFLIGCNDSSIDLNSINLDKYTLSNTISLENALSDLEIEENFQQCIPYPKVAESNYQKLMRRNQLFSKDTIPVVFNHITTKHSPSTIKKIKARKATSKKYSDVSGTILSTSNQFVRIGDNIHLSPHLTRTYSLRECARIQSFSDDFLFYGNKKEIMLQIADAVPPLLSEVIAKIILDLSI